MAKIKYKSPRLRALHEISSAPHRVGAMDKKTLRDIDAFCLTPVAPIAPDEIEELRAKEDGSQAVLAHHLNVGGKLVQRP
jgi:putative transcriptional regulator